MTTTAMVTVQGAEAIQLVERNFWSFVEEWLTALTGKDADGNSTGKRARSLKTISTYRYNLQLFKDWLDSEGITSPTRRDVKKYRAAVGAKAWTVASKNVALAAVRSFFNWLSKEYDFENIAAGVDGWEVSPEHKRGTLNLSEMKDLMAVVDKVDLKGNRKKLTKHDEELINLRRLRDRAILAVLCGAGLRTVEVARLRVVDIFKTAGTNYLRVLGKGRDDFETVKISGKVAKIIRDWTATREAVDLVSDSSPLFCSISYRSFGEQLTPHAISTLVKFYLEAAHLKTKEAESSDGTQIAKPVTAHSLRASLATNSYLGGATLNEIKQQLRHRSVVTSMRYIDEAKKSLNPCADIVAAIF